MQLISTSFILVPLLATASLAALNHQVPRSLNAILVDHTPSPTPTPSPQLRDVDLLQDLDPHLRRLELRQAVAAPAAPVAANPAQAANPVAAPGQAAPIAPNVAPAAAPAPVANPAPVNNPNAAAPVAGVGGGAVPGAQPGANAQANPVTTIMVQTVVGGVTKQVPVAFTQTFGAGASAPAVQSGEIGLGTLTGKIGVVKTSEAKSDAVARGGERRGKDLLVLLATVGVGMGIGGGLFGMGLGML